MDRFVTVGVAGHVDHGKTTLVSKLTGVNTDRMSEEKRRGLTIEPGVAPLLLPPDICVSFVDVPGHRDFLKNAIRGLSCVDMGILVVAADDGVMPQTIDHLDILNFLGAQTGLIVISKSDIVDEETLDLAKMEVTDLTCGTFLENKPLIAFSGVNGEGTSDVLDCIRVEIEQLESRNPETPFRMWIDQSRTISGFGTVVSGQILSGKINCEHSVEILPTGNRGVVRFLETHHKRVDQAVAGQRVGINLNRLTLEEARVGMQLSTPGAMHASKIINVELRLLKKATKPIYNRQRLKLYIGSISTQAMVTLMEVDQLYPDQTCLAQLRLRDPIAVWPRDTFIVSMMNNPSVIGGGTILESSRDKFRDVKAEITLNYLKSLQSRDVKGVLKEFFQRFPWSPVTSDDIAIKTGLPAEEIHKQLKLGSKRGKFIALNGLGYIDRNGMEAIQTRVVDVVNSVLSTDAFKQGINSNEIRTRMNPALDEPVFEKIIEKLCNENKLIKNEKGLSVPNIDSSLSSHQGEIVKSLLKFARCCGYATFSPGTFHKLNSINVSYGNIQRAINFLCSRDKLVKLNDGRFLNAEVLPEIMEKFRRIILAKGNLSVQDLKTVLGYGRTNGIPVLDYLDSIGFTKRIGDLRVLNESYASIEEYQKQSEVS